MNDFYDELNESQSSGAAAQSVPPQEKIEPWGETRIVGKALPRVDAYERVSGAAQYTYDVLLPGMLHAAILRSPHAHAMVKAIDTSAAEKMPGVVAVLTQNSPGANIPWYGGRTAQSKLFDPHCRYEGDEVAAVAARTPYQAWDALKAIKVTYEELPFVICTIAATRPAIRASPREAMWRRGSRMPTWSWKRPFIPTSRFMCPWKFTVRWSNGMATR
jgi:xanthine dehydrogenase YagR molybdenum-binding subunit